MSEQNTPATYKHHYCAKDFFGDLNKLNERMSNEKNKSMVILDIINTILINFALTIRIISLMYT